MGYRFFINRTLIVIKPSPSKNFQKKLNSVYKNLMFLLYIIFHSHLDQVTLNIGISTAVQIPTKKFSKIAFMMHQGCDLVLIVFHRFGPDAFINHNNRTHRIDHKSKLLFYIQTARTTASNTAGHGFCQLSYRKKSSWYSGQIAENTQMTNLLSTCS